MTARRRTAERERRAVVSFLLEHDPSKDRRSFQLPLISTKQRSAMRAAARRRATSDLMSLRQAVERARRTIPALTSTQMQANPLLLASIEITNKLAKRPAEFRLSSKLFRAIDDIECARGMDCYGPCDERLRAIVDQLRFMTGWTERD